MVLDTGIARHVRRSAALRPLGVKAYRGYMRLRPMGPGPRILANSIPKSGTHLLMQLLDSCPGLHFSGRMYATGAVSRDEEAAAAARALGGELAKVRRSQYMCGHVAYDPQIRDSVDGSGAAHLLMVRDPRDLATSTAAYVSNNQRHMLHHHFVTEYGSLEERTRAVIDGIPPADGHRGLPPLSERLERYVRWLGDDDVFLVRFEDLVGSAGGGSLQAQRRLIGRLFAHLGLEYTDETVASVGDRVFSPKSATFRKGQVGGWKEELSEANRGRLEDTCGSHIARLGYA